jgi:hypothetical protein
MNNKRWNKFVPLVVVVLLIILFVAFYSPARGYFNKLFFGTNNLAQVSSTQCNDGIDNDGDGLTDWQNDLGCYGPQDNTEGGISASTDNGWTVFEKSPDTHIIYVSSSTGSDINDGLTPGTAVQTIAAGSALLRNGYPDWLLLKRGDTWHEGFSNWKKSGRSATAPLVIASYGPSSVRPLLDTTQPIYAQSATPGEIPSYVAIVGMNFYAGERDPNSPEYVAGTEGDSGIRWLGGGNLLIEDTVIRFYRTGITISPVNTPTLPNIKIRRSIIADSYINTAHSQGLFVDGVDGLLIEDNVFDHNGWNDNAAVGKETVFNHNIYSEPGNQNVTIRNNIIARASSHGLQARGGGTISDNLFFRDAVGMSFGLVNGGDNAKIGGVEGIISNNVYLESKNIGTSIRGYALEITNTKPGGTTAFRNNIIAHVTSGAASDAIQIGYGQPLDPNSAIGVNDLSIVGNTIYEWPPVYISPNLVPGGTGYTALKNLSFTNNDFQYLTSQYPNDPIIFHGPAFSSANESFAGNRYMSSLSKASWFSVASALLLGIPGIQLSILLVPISKHHIQIQIEVLVHIMHHSAVLPRLMLFSQKQKHFQNITGMIDTPLMLSMITFEQALGLGVQVLRHTPFLLLQVLEELSHQTVRFRLLAVLHRRLPLQKQVAMIFQMCWLMVVLLVLSLHTHSRTLQQITLFQLHSHRLSLPITRSLLQPELVVPFRQVAP